ncbi:MAG: hypothetical protein ACLFRX_11130, partial [Gemmatimonadota bacterium]
VLEKLLSGPVLLNRAFGEPAPPRAASFTPLGLPADRAHRIRMYLGPAVSLGASRLEAFPQEGAAVLYPGEGAWSTSLGVESELSTVEPGDAGGVHETGGLPLTRLELHVGLTELTPTELDLRAETVFDGWRRGALRPAGADQVRGYRWIVSPATAFSARLDHTPGARWMEMMANAHVVGLRADGVLVDGPWRLRWTGAAYGDFSSIRPLALDEYVLGGNGIDRSNAVLRRNQYYYSWGATLRSRLALDLGPVGVRGEVGHHTFEPVRGPHRKHDEFGADRLALWDRRTYARAWVELRPTDRWVVAAGVDAWAGRGRMGEYVVDGDGSRFNLRVTATP